MDYRQEYESYLSEKQRLRDVGEDTTLFIKAFSNKVKLLPEAERNAFNKVIMEVERERTESDLKVLKEEFGIDVEFSKT